MNILKILQCFVNFIYICPYTDMIYETLLERVYV